MSDMEWEDTGPVLLRASRVRYSARATGSDLSSLEDSAEPVGICDRQKGGGEVQVAGIDHPDDNERPSKRRKHCAEVHTSTVRVIYKNLTRESRNKLQAVLKQWSEWCGHGAVASEEEFAENGDDLFFPALEVGHLSRSSVPVWIDRPLRKGGKEQALGGLLLSSSKEREAEIPLYDRVCNPVSARDSPVRPEGLLEVPREASRCFNCGSYSHALKDCPRPRDHAAINNARKLKASASGGPRPAGRYYQSPSGKFDGIKPGFLGKETRQILGIGEWDPPPWLNRMRQMGYPPGYLEKEEDDVPSGVVIFGAEESDVEDAGSAEDGEILQGTPKPTTVPGQMSPPKRNSKPFSTINSSMTKKMVVEYAGVNAPVPEMADKRLWAARSNVQVPGMQRLPYLQHSTSAPLPFSSDGTSPPGYTSLGYDSPSQMYGAFSSRGLPLSPPRSLPSPTPLLPSPTREYSPIRTDSGHAATGLYGSQYEPYTTAHGFLASERVPSPSRENAAWVRAQSNLIAYHSRSRATNYRS